MSAVIIGILPPVLGFLLDLALGDPVWLYHPVRLIGGLIERLEKPLRAFFPDTVGGERWAGAVLTAAVLFVTVLCVCVLTVLAMLAGVWGWVAMETLLCWMLLAAKSLRVESMRVHERLEANDLPGARAAVSRIVGRDTDALDETGVAKAAVETVAENTADGVVAPLFYMMLGGALLGWCYKAVNTLDSMVGYRNERYRNYGTVPAKLDDAANFIPARLAALCMVLASDSSTSAWRVWRRDRRNHDSPNSAQTEAALAGALGIRLGGDASYFGETHHKPTIGDDTRPVTPADIPAANRLMLWTSVISLLLLLTLRVLLLRALG